MSRIYLPWNASNARVRAAERARKNRAEIVRELSWGRVSRRDLLKMGLFTGAGLLAPIGGLNPFVRSAAAQTGGVPRSPLFGVQPFTQPMPRVDVLARNQPACLTPAPTAQANQTLMAVDNKLGGGMGPIEGRPPGAVWAHQRWNEFLPNVAVEAVQAPATTNYMYNPQVASSLNSGIEPSHGLPVRFHPKLPTQNPSAVWTFNGTIPPKLVQGRYGDPMLFRHHNGLPADVRDNGGFGRHTITTHKHNGHHGAENDGFTGAFFFPNQYYDYHWPIVLAGHFSMNTGATDRMASTPDGSGGLTRIPGDWHETMSSHWFHDHMFSFTAQNVYKGNAALFNIYSGLDRGNEEIDDGVNLRLPSGTAKDWGNLEYDVNLLICEKAFDRDGQLTYDIFNFDGFMGDVNTVNFAVDPFFEVERRKYRFRILNGSVARFYKIALANASGAAQPIVQIANDGNLLPSPVTLTELDDIGIAERYDIVIDFSRFAIGEKVHMVNLADHFDDEEDPEGKLNGKKIVRHLSLAEALSGTSSDPCVGRFLEFRVVRDPARPDVSRVPNVLIPNPDLSQVPVTRVRNFVFGRDARQTTFDPETSFPGPWGVATDGGQMLAADYARISAAPKFGTREVWNLINDGGGWDHPIHVHFEESQILARDGSAANVPAWERGRKDVFRLRPGGRVTISMQFRDWGGMFMEHCHNTSHEDNAMLMRWEINGGGDAFLAPLPTPVPTPQGVTFVSPSEILPTAL
jgi:FtsP/CotA-like multicopper oxidase with cupredoxin domain